MNYLTTLYGDYQEQKQVLKELEFDIFCRKLILLAHLSKEFKKYDCDFYLTFEHEFKKVYFSINKENTQPKYNGIISLLLTMDEYNLPSEFVEENNEIINILFKLEEEFSYSYYPNRTKTNIPIILNSTEWIEAIFSLCEKQNDFPKFMNNYLNNKLPEKNKEKVLLKI